MHIENKFVCVCKSYNYTGFVDCDVLSLIYWLSTESITFGFYKKQLTNCLSIALVVKFLKTN